MFKRGIVNRGKIRSDEGFTVTLVGRSQLVYEQGRSRVSIPGELLTDGFGAEISRVKSWDDGTPFTAGEWPAIQDRVRRALCSQEMTFDIVDRDHLAARADG